jgi:hypothetical protein
MDNKQRSTTISGGWTQSDDGKYYAVLVLHDDEDKKLYDGPHDTLDEALDVLEGFRKAIAFLDPDGTFHSHDNPNKA